MILTIKSQPVLWPCKDHLYVSPWRKDILRPHNFGFGFCAQVDNLERYTSKAKGFGVEVDHRLQGMPNGALIWRRATVQRSPAILAIHSKAKAKKEFLHPKAAKAKGGLGCPIVPTKECGAYWRPLGSIWLYFGVVGGLPHLA